MPKFLRVQFTNDKTESNDNIKLDHANSDYVTKNATSGNSDYVTKNAPSGNSDYITKNNNTNDSTNNDYVTKDLQSTQKNQNTNEQTDYKPIKSLASIQNVTNNTMSQKIKVKLEEVLKDKGK